MAKKKIRTSALADRSKLSPHDSDSKPTRQVGHVDDLGKKFVREIEEFFVNYHALSSKKYSIIAVKGPEKSGEESKMACAGQNESSSRLFQ